MPDGRQEWGDYPVKPGNDGVGVSNGDTINGEYQQKRKRHCPIPALPST